MPAMDADRALRLYKDYFVGRHRLNSYKDALDFAQFAAQKLNLIVRPEVFEGMSEQEVFAYIEPLFREMHSRVSTAARTVQSRINRSAGIGLNPLVAEYDAAAVQTIAVKIVGGEALAEIPKDIASVACKDVDETARKNMEAQDRSGLEVKIIRRYDGVGVHNGKDVCQWCLDREGEFDSYADAFNAGVFERHPGCGCTVEYHVGRTHSFRGADGSWHDI